MSKDLISRSLFGGFEPFRWGFDDNFGKFYTENLADKGDHYEYELDAPKGVTPGDINIEISNDNEMTIKYKCISTDKCHTVIYSSVTTLPSDADLDNMDAFLENDLIIISIGKIKDENDNDATNEDNGRQPIDINHI